ncbi:MAG: AraC family transcriptional regulator [Pseudomonadota bacterium]
MSKKAEVLSAAYIRPVFDTITRLGLPTERHLALNGLGKFRIYDNDAMLPKSLAFEFFDYMYRREGDELISEIMRNYSLLQVPVWGDATLSRPDIFSALRFAAATAPIISSESRLDIGFSGKTVIVTHTFGDGMFESELKWGSVWTLPLAIEIMRLACGPEWRPYRIDLTDDSTKIYDGVFDFAGVDIRLAQPNMRLHFGTLDLSKRLSVSRSKLDLPQMAYSQADRVFRLLDALGPGSSPTLIFVATSLNLSPRTLERLLAAEGQTFSSVLKSWRLERAFALLNQPDMGVAEVAARLHYSNSSHLGRAFRSWTGKTPLEYRDA